MLGHPEAPAVSSPESEQTALHHSPPTPASSLPSSHVDGEEFFKGGDLMFLQKSLSGTPSRSGSCKKRPKTCHPHSTAWSVATEKGYRYTEANYEDIHADLEDVHFPSSLSEKQTALCGAKVYILADGHGGPGAARYLVPRLASAVLELLDSLKQQQQQDMPLSGTADWDFSCPKDRELLSTSIKALFLSLDKEYASYKTAQFKKWSAYKRQTQMNKENSQPMDESLDDKEEIVSKPDDDGMFFLALNLDMQKKLTHNPL